MKILIIISMIFTFVGVGFGHEWDKREFCNYNESEQATQTCWEHEMVVASYLRAEPLRGLGDIGFRVINCWYDTDGESSYCMMERQKRCKQ